jgi:hypothetical protein
MGMHHLWVDLGRETRTGGTGTVGRRCLTACLCVNQTSPMCVFPSHALTLPNYKGF